MCGDNPNVFLLTPNTQPPCHGLNTATPGAGYPTYPGLGTFYSAGQPALTYAGSLIPASALSSYLTPGPDGFVTLDWKRFKADSNYDTFHDNSPEATSSNTSANSGFVRERPPAPIVQLSGDTKVGASENRLRYTLGVRRVRTEQTIGGIISLPDPGTRSSLRRGRRRSRTARVIPTS